MTPLRALLFCMPEFGHLKRMLPLISSLSSAGVEVHVFSDPRFADLVASNSGIFHDLFRDRPLERADNQSRPIPCRYVSFAAYFAESVIEEAVKLKPGIVLHDAFAVVAVPVANRLGLPRINVCPGHNLAPQATVAALKNDARVQIAPACFRAVDILRQQYGMPNASPFSYVDSLSHELNLICEPPQFLTGKESEAFAPAAFFGSLSEEVAKDSVVGKEQKGLRIYASLGTVIWRYFAEKAWSVLEALSQAASQLDDVSVLIGLGGQPLTARSDGLEQPNVRVESYVDQWRALARADVYLTHHGLNSTHEAIYQRVAMLSYPFFSDQPGLAKRCQEFGLAEQLIDDVCAPVTTQDIFAALERIAAERDTMDSRLMIARGWEQAVMATRPEVISRIIAFT